MKITTTLTPRNTSTLPPAVALQLATLLSQPGAPGVKGSVWLAGTTAPANGLGTAGDYYINTVTLCLYGPKTTVWPASFACIAGTILSAAVQDALNAANAPTALNPFVTTTALTGYATAAQGALADTALQPGDQVAVGTVSTFYLDRSVTISDNQFLSPSPSAYPEEVDTTSCDSDINGGVSFLERFISGPLGVNTIPAGNWTFHTWGAADSVVGDNYIHTRINKRCEQTGMTGTFTGAGPTRTFTVTGGAPFVAGDANASILLASLIETPTQTAFISGFTSASVVTVTLTDPAFVNVSNVELRAIYYLLFSQQSDDLTTAGVVQEMSNTYIQAAPITGLAITDRIVAAYFGKTTSNVARNISLYHGGSARYSHIETPLLGNLITQTITNGNTTTAPSEDAVFDALAGKVPIAQGYINGQRDTRTDLAPADGSTATLNCLLGNAFTITSPDTGAGMDFTIALSNVPTGAVVFGVEVDIIVGTNIPTVSPPTGATLPTFQANKKHEMVFRTWDNGTSWRCTSTGVF